MKYWECSVHLYRDPWLSSPKKLNSITPSQFSAFCALLAYEESWVYWQSTDFSLHLQLSFPKFLNSEISRLKFSPQQFSWFFKTLSLKDFCLYIGINCDVLQANFFANECETGRTMQKSEKAIDCNESNVNINATYLLQKAR